MMKKVLLASILSLFIFFAVGLTYAFAQGGSNQGDITGQNVRFSTLLQNPFRGGDSLFALLRNIVNNILLPIGGVLAVLAFIFSGFLYVTAQGNETKLQRANRALLYTAIGTAVLLGAWILANAICETIEQLGGPTCPSF